MVVPADDPPFPTGTAALIAIVLLASAPIIEALGHPGPGLHPYTWTALFMGPALLGAAALDHWSGHRRIAQGLVGVALLVTIGVGAALAPPVLPGAFVRPAAIIPLIVAAAVLANPVVVALLGVFFVASSWMLGDPAARPTIAQATAQLVAAAFAVALAQGFRRTRQVAVVALRLEAEVAHRQVAHDAIARFVRNASHELRTPLTPLFLIAATLEGRGDDPAVRNRALGQMTRQLDRLASIVARLATLSEISEDHNSVRQSLVAALRATTTDPRVELRVPESAWVVAPRDSAEMIAGELIGNALLACQTKVHVHLAREDGFWRLVVEDDGHGQPDDVRQGMHEPFARASHAVHPHERSGLGLALVDAMVKAASGRFELEASPMGGISAIVDLPAAEP